MISFLVEYFLLFTFWIFLSGKMDLFHLGVGAFFALLITGLSRKYAPKKESTSWALSSLAVVPFRAFFYGFYLLKNIVLAALHVTRLILSPKMPITPQFIRHRTILNQDTAKVLFGNSITLTPGTITVEMKGQEMVVHELDSASSESIRKGEMEKEIQKIFSGGA